MPGQKARAQRLGKRRGRSPSVAARPTYQIRAVERALEVLATFSASEPTMTLARIAQKTGLHKATLVRMLRSLESLGFISQTSGGAYELGIKVFELGSVYYVTHLRIEPLARPAMERLAERWHLTANLAVLDHGQIVYVGIVEPRRALRVQFSVGSRFAVHCTALGKALAADLADPELDSLLTQQGLPRFTDRTIVDADEFKRHLQGVQERGYAIDDGEAIPNVRCVAAPILDFSGRAVASISLSGSALDVTDDAVPEIASTLQQACADVSRSLGAGLGLDASTWRRQAGAVMSDGAASTGAARPAGGAPAPEEVKARNR
jgi:IclR family transcriptional regulator, KDG regulon repressor